MATRTLAFQVSEKLLQRIKTFLARYEQIYHRKLSQKEFLVHLIERELDEAEKDYERIATEQAAEENADVDSGEPDGTEMEVDTLYNKEISLCEAGVGTGKTLAYLVGCILWQMNRPERMKLPIVISTSSVALQDAILTEYLPDLSAILLDEGIITAPITAVVRKGKERFVCDARLAERASLVQPSRKRQRNSLRIAENILDMDHIPELSRYDRCRICVPQSCPRDCFMRLDCRYQQYLRDSMKPDIQICNLCAMCQQQSANCL